MNFRFWILDFGSKRGPLRAGVNYLRDLSADGLLQGGKSALPALSLTNPKSKIQNPKLKNSTSGMALVVTLALIVLVTIASMAFFVRATLNRSIEASRSNAVLAEQLAETGVDYVTSQFLQEIATNSTTNTVSGVAIYNPTAATNIIPQRSLPSGISSTDTNFSNLLRGSYAGTDPNASTINTATPSQDGRFIGTSRWNAPLLLAGAGFTATNQLPNWIYLNRDGNPTATASTNAIGRFAYTVYDVGGLLDVNVSGYPASVTGANLSNIKGTLAGADLSQIPGITSATMNTFVTWRNANSTTTAANYVTNVSAAATGGFLTPRPGDRNLLSRQDLIALARSGNYGLTTNALPYLSTFSRAINSPTWSPTTPTGSTIDYFTNRDSATAANRFLPNVRVSTTPFTRADGTTAQVGESLLKSRFPLSRIAGLSPTGVNTSGNTTLLSGVPSPASATTIQRDFGLVWNSDRWTYAGPSGSSVLASIATLGSISGREPNFFELLKASILSGSLGIKAGTSLIANSAAFDAVPDQQILQIGANIIDQYDGNSYPTKVTFNGNDYAGVENLPYLNRLFRHFYRLTTDPGNNRGYFMLELWNPHRPKANTVGPTSFRAIATGQMTMGTGSIEDKTKAPWVYDYGIYMPASTPAGNRTTDTSITAPFTIKNGWKTSLGPLLGSNGPLQFTVPLGSTTLFNFPTLLTQSVANATAAGSNSVSDNGYQFVGFYAGNVTCSEETYPNRGSEKCNSADLIVSITPSFSLQYEDAGGNWVTYSSWPNINSVGTDGGPGNGRKGVGTSPGIYQQVADPRSLRFGAYLNYCINRTTNTAWTDPTFYEDSLGVTSRRDSSLINNTVDSSLPYGAGFWPPSGSLYPPATAWGPTPFQPNRQTKGSFGVMRFGYLAENKVTLANGASSPTYYRDNDNILRNGDAAYASSSATGWGQPLEQANAARGLASRPMILDRPFRSVAEMGYAFRDLPWKSLDFFTVNSADACLLDTFSLTESPATGVTAGVLNPNTRQQTVLKAVLAGALKDELDASSTLAAASEADTVATKVTTATAATPLLNRSELATRIAPALAATDFVNNPADSAIKARRESVVRALADVSNTRTWNLMVDVVAQSGRSPVSSSSPPPFLVEGERRYWLHVAIDRFTGRVVARSMEPINE